MASAMGDKALCSLHGKMRSTKNLEDAGDGSGLCCAAGFECTQGNRNVVCRFFQEGKCTKGDACGFSHEVDHPPLVKGKDKGKGAGKDWGAKGGKDWGMPPWMKGGKGLDSWDAWGPAFGPYGKGMKGMKGMDMYYGMGWGKGDGKGFGKDAWGATPWGVAPWDAGYGPWEKGCKGFQRF